MSGINVLSTSAIPHASTSTIRHKPRITLTPATPAAFSAIATADLLAFTGISGELASRCMFPLRRDLVRCGAHPRHWPDFQFTIESLSKGAREGKIMVMAIVEDPDATLLADGSTKLCGRGEQSKGLVSVDGVKGVVAGLAKLQPPACVRQAIVARRTAASRIWGDYVTLAAQKLRESVVGPDATGIDSDFLSMFRGEMVRVRKQNMTESDWHLEWIFVHPAYQGLGIGRALLEHAQTLAESTDPLVFPYPTTYTPKSMTNIQPPHSSAFSISSSPSAGNTPLDKDSGPDHQEMTAALCSVPRKARIFLEASNAGAPVYARLGFRTISRSTVEYKGEQVSWPVMVWEGSIA